MKIGLTTPLHTIGGNTTGGTATFVTTLAKGLIKKGHQVDIFTVGTSTVPGNKIAVLDKGVFDEEADGYNVASKDIAGTLKILDIVQKTDYDIVHNNQVNFLALARFCQLPNGLSTLHAPTDWVGLRIALDLDPTVAEANFVAMSEYQKKSKDIKFIDLIYNGIDVNAFTFNPTPQPYAAWLSRLEPKKGLKEAIDIAEAAGLPLKFAGSKQHDDYFAQIIAYSQDKGAEYLGHADAALRNELLGNARVFLFTTQWPESFGFVAAEAMACGTPVIAQDIGAIKEVVKDGVTGYVCPAGDLQAMKEATKRILAMPAAEYQAMRVACRRHVEENFSLDAMVNGYEQLYQRLIDQRKAK